MRPKNLEKEQALRRIALEIISKEGLENLSMQKLAKAANVSPRTIYIKYENKEDFLVKLFIVEVMGAYEKASLEGFHPEMSLAEGVEKLWLNGFRFLKNNRPFFSLMLYGKSSPLLNRAFQQMDIREGDYFSPIHQFLQRHTASNVIPDLPMQVQRAMLFAAFFDLMNEYFDCLDRPVQIVTEETMRTCARILVNGMLTKKIKP